MSKSMVTRKRRIIKPKSAINLTSFTNRTDRAKSALLSRNISVPAESIMSYQTVMEKRCRFFANLGIILTEKCNIRCDHCIFDCHDSQVNELDEKVIENILNQATGIDMINLVGFTGGEPFLMYEKLVRLVQVAVSLGIKVSAITNGYWATSVSVAARRLHPLASLNNLAVSTDQFHQKFVDIGRVKNVVAACHELHIPCHIRVSYLNDPKREIDRIKGQLKEVEGLYILETQPVTPTGRAATHIDMNDIFSYDVKGTPCLAIDRPVISAKGDFFACCGPPLKWGGDHPLLLGNIHEQTLNDIVHGADGNPILHAIRLWGPIELYRLVKGQAEKERITIDIGTSDEFSEMCSLCKSILTNPHSIRLLNRAVEDPGIYRKIAISRLIELGEVSMTSVLEDSRSRR